MCMSSQCTHTDYLNVEDTDCQDRMCPKCHRIFRKTKKKAWL